MCDEQSSVRDETKVKNSLDVSSKDSAHGSATMLTAGCMQHSLRPSDAATLSEYAAYSYCHALSGSLPSSTVSKRVNYFYHVQFSRARSHIFLYVLQSVYT